MIFFKVGREKQKAFFEKISRLGIKQEDVIEEFIKSRGPGGQNVNKTSTCVYLRHIPTGIEVKSRRQRSQALNRYAAWQLLIRKIEGSILKGLSEEKQRIEKIRRQRRPKPRSLKLKILEEKHRLSEKKKMRAKIHLSDDGY